MSNQKRYNRPSTMIDVAREAGVSLKTVSRVLNGESYVSEKTKAVVIEAASRLSYQLNQAARTLRAGAVRTVMLFVDNPSSNYLDKVHLGALEQCHAQGMQLLVTKCPNGLDDVKNAIAGKEPVGFILTPPLSDDRKIVDYLTENDSNFVLLSPGNDDIAPLSVNMDDRAAAFELTKSLVEKGHRHIACIQGHPDHAASSKRFEGYCDALREAGLTVDETLIKQGYFDYASGLTCGSELLDLPDPPTAIFASNDDMAAAVLSAAYARKIRIPDRLLVAGFDDSQIAGIISPQLTSVRQPITEMAGKAVDLLVENLSPLGDAEQHIMLDYEIIERESTAASVA